jgi:hypothetical protein
MLPFPPHQLSFHRSAVWSQVRNSLPDNPSRTSISCGLRCHCVGWRPVLGVRAVRSLPLGSSLLWLLRLRLRLRLLSLRLSWLRLCWLRSSSTQIERRQTWSIPGRRRRGTPIRSGVLLRRNGGNLELFASFAANVILIIAVVITVVIEAVDPFRRLVRKSQRQAWVIREQ